MGLGEEARPRVRTQLAGLRDPLQEAAQGQQGRQAVAEEESVKTVLVIAAVVAINLIGPVVMCYGYRVVYLDRKALK